MNYGKKGVRKKQQALHSTSTKWGKKIGFTFIQICLIALISVGIIGISAGIGVFKGVLASAPDMSNIDVTPTGFSTFVYDIENNQTAKLVSFRRICRMPLSPSRMLVSTATTALILRESSVPA